MPGSVSDSYDPEWGTSANAEVIRDAEEELARLGGKPTPSPPPPPCRVRDPHVALAIADAGYVLRWLLQMHDGGMMLPTNIVELSRRAVSVFGG